jgi:hypothetical protein
MINCPVIGYTPKVRLFIFHRQVTYKAKLQLLLTGLKMLAQYRVPARCGPTPLKPPLLSCQRDYGDDPSWIHYTNVLSNTRGSQGLLELPGLQHAQECTHCYRLGRLACNTFLYTTFQSSTHDVSPITVIMEC